MHQLIIKDYSTNDNVRDSYAVVIMPRQFNVKATFNPSERRFYLELTDDDCSCCHNRVIYNPFIPVYSTVMSELEALKFDSKILAVCCLNMEEQFICKAADFLAGLDIAGNPSEKPYFDFKAFEKHINALFKKYLPNYKRPDPEQ